MTRARPIPTRRYPSAATVARSLIAIVVVAFAAALVLA